MKQLWIEPDVNNLKIEDLVTYVYDKKVGREYGSYEIKYKQQSNQLCRFPLLYPFFFEKECFNKVHWNDFHNFLKFEPCENSLINKKQLIEMIYHSFCDNKNISIDYSNLELRENPMWVDEPFEQYRQRMLWEIRDYLGFNHYGRGSDNDLVKSSKYFRGNKFKETEDNQILIRLD
jgi:hypothetical protein